MSVFGPSASRTRVVVSTGVVEERNGKRPAVFRVISPFVPGAFPTLAEAAAARASAAGRGTQRLPTGPAVRVEGNLPFISRLRSKWVAHVHGRFHAVFDDRLDAARAVAEHLRRAGRPLPPALAAAIDEGAPAVDAEAVEEVDAEAVEGVDAEAHALAEDFDEHVLVESEGYATPPRLWSSLRL